MQLCVYKCPTFILQIFFFYAFADVADKYKIVLLT